MKLRNHKILILFTIELLILLCFLPGILRKREVVTDINPFIEWEKVNHETQLVMESDDIVLSHGVYEVTLDFEPLSEEGVFLCMRADNPSFYGVMCDLKDKWYVPRANSDAVRIRAYIADKTATLKFTLAVPLDSYCGLERIVITKTCMGSLLFMVLYVMVALFVDLCIYLKDRVEADKSDFTSQVVFWGIIGCSIYTLLPELTDCLGANGISLKFLDDFSKLREGIGTPVVLTAVPLVFYKLGFPAAYAYKIVLLIINVIFATAIYFVFKKIFSDRRIAAFGMFAFMMNPSRLNVMFGLAEPAFKKVITGYAGAFLIAFAITGVIAFVTRKFENNRHLRYIVCGLAVAFIFMLAAYNLDAIALSAEPLWMY